MCLPFTDNISDETKTRGPGGTLKLTQNKKNTFTDLAFTCLPDLAMLDGMCVKNANDLKWNTHIRNACTKVNIILRFLRRTLFSCTQDVKEAAKS